MYSDQFSIKFINCHVLLLASVLYCFIQVSSFISLLLRIRGIFVSLLCAVISISASVS